MVGATLVEPDGVASAAAAHGPTSFASSTTTPAVKAANTGKGIAISAAARRAPAIQASQTSTASNATAVQGAIKSTSPGSSSAGVRGVNNGTGGNGVGVYGSQSGSGYGVYGYTPHGTGVVGESGNEIGVRGTALAGGYGLYGYTGDGYGYAVYGEAGNGFGVYGNAGAGVGAQGSADTGTGVRGSSSSGYGVYGSSDDNYGAVGVSTSGNGVYGQVSVAPQAGVVGRQVDSSGNYAIFGFGNIGATGTKSAVVPAADGSGHLTLYCIESPECWFEDFGSARLSAGTTSVRIDPEFAQTVETGQYHVFLQAEGECQGLSVQDKTPTGFVVREFDGGTSNAPLPTGSWRGARTSRRLNRVMLPEAPKKVR